MLWEGRVLGDDDRRLERLQALSEIQAHGRKCKSEEEQWPVGVLRHNNVGMSISLEVQESHEQVAWRNEGE